ncbi:MAG TPA: aldehyde dehydrogenase family protein, partial [Sphingomonadaceae bacterium]|nr:aldehyde dehydrogenase family protein [Sphingomonadaceae bacterium]
MTGNPGPICDLFYDGGWHPTLGGERRPTYNPATGEALAEIAEAGAEDVDAVVAAARRGFRLWRDVTPAERAAILRETANRIRAHAEEFAALDARNGGNPIDQLRNFVGLAADSVDFFAGLVTEIKGDTIPMGPGRLNLSMREPYGVVARIVAFNHPFMFAASRLAAPLVAGNVLILKPSDQAPLSALRLADLVGDLYPAGV